MSRLSIRVESIGIASDFGGAGNITAPNTRGAAVDASDSLDAPQAAARIGDSVPIVFGERIDNTGGILISPRATEARFENDAGNNVTAYYHLVLSEGVLDFVQVRDAFQQSCRVGTFTQAYNRRAGDWGPGNFIVPQTGFEDEVPDAPIFCGTANGSYADMTTGSFKVTIPRPFDQWNRQVHLFIRGGMHVDRLLRPADDPAASNNVADLILWMLRNSSRLPEVLIDKESLTLAARFTDKYQLWCNTEISEPSNLADWLSSNLKYFLLRESRRNGKKGLRPLLPVTVDGTIDTSPVIWTCELTEENILGDLFEISYSSAVDRRPFGVSVIWRQQPDDALGLARNTLVRYAGSASDGPFEQHDISKYATTEQHAVRVGAYILSRRRYVDHRLTIAVKPETLTQSLTAGDIVRVRLMRTASVGEQQLHDFLYEVDKISKDMQGGIVLELTHFPVDNKGRSIVAQDVLAAEPTGVMLPTGRADVNCDLNDPFDTGFVIDLGPWPEWDPLDLDFNIKFDLDFPGWVFDFDNQKWVQIDGFPDPVPEPVIYPELGDGWGAGIGSLEGFDGLGELDEVETTVTLSNPFIRYPDVWYLILQNNFAFSRVEVNVNPAPTASLTLTIDNGTEQRQVTVAKDETTASLVMNVNGDSISSPTTRTFQVVDWSSEAEFDVSSTVSVSVAAYPVNVSFESIGVWLYNTDDAKWKWLGSDPSDFTWDEEEQKWIYLDTQPDWAWSDAEQHWTSVSSPSGWTWETGVQQWRRTSSTQSSVPDFPPPKAPLVPATLPPQPFWYSISARAKLSEVPTDNTSRFQMEIVDQRAIGGTVQSSEVGTLEIPAATMYFNSWKWNPAAQVWEHMRSPADWQWNVSQWQYIGRERGSWQWNPGDLDWEWTGGEEVTEPKPATMPPANPDQAGSRFPPDAQRWSWTGRRWVGNFYVEGGTPPITEGLRTGEMFYHMPR